MFLSNKCDHLACSPSTGISARASLFRSISTLFISLVPFLATFFGLGYLLLQRIFPLISQQINENLSSPRDALFNFSNQGAKNDTIMGRRRQLIALTFSVTTSLAAVLAELILCEISNTLDPLARSLAFKAIISSLLFSLIILTPFLELQSIISSAGWTFDRTENGKIPRAAWLLQGTGFCLWLLGFWCLGKDTHIYTMASQSGKGLTAACLERVGIIGIALMALLSGFAAVSAVWHTFGAKLNIVNENEIFHKRKGLDFTHELLSVRQTRLRAIQRNMKEGPNENLITKFISIIRGNSESQEIHTLESEISGLKYIASNLSSSINLLQNRLAYSRRRSSRLGRILFVPVSYGFSIYCLYRIITTVITNVRRIIYHSPKATIYHTPNTDPINRILSLVAKHIDPNLNQVAWSRQISFLLSGVILLASFKSVLTTFHMLSKISPSLLHQARANLSLLIAQISATYVISSALLLRSNLPNEMKSIVNEAMGSPLEPGFVERWFDAWFLLASLGTPVGIWITKKMTRKVIWDNYEISNDNIELGQKTL